MVYLRVRISVVYRQSLGQPSFGGLVPDRSLCRLRKDLEASRRRVLTSGLDLNPESGKQWALRFLWRSNIWPINSDKFTLGLEEQGGRGEGHVTRGTSPTKQNRPARLREGHDSRLGAALQSSLDFRTHRRKCEREGAVD